jgi:hypothetical protein
MSTGLKANADGSAAIQVGGTDYINISSAGAVSIPQTLAVTGATTFAAGSASTPSITFTGDTNTGIYSPGADRIGFTEGGTQVGEFDASGNFLFNSGYGSVATAYGCRAWVNFNATNAFTPNPSTSAIRASGNVTSITKGAAGSFTINFTNAMPDANYSPTLGWEYRGANQNSGGFTVAATLAGSCGVFFASSAAAYDPPIVSVAVFR